MSNADVALLMSKIYFLKTNTTKELPKQPQTLPQLSNWLKH